MTVEDQGVDSKRYALIPRTLIFLTRGEQVLLLRGAAHKRLWANLYNGVGGHIERGEDVLSAARRELLEESGLQPISLWLCGTVLIDSGQNPGVAIFILRGECPAGEAQESEEGTLEWIRRDQLASLPLVEDLPTLLPKVLAQQAGQAPFAAHYHYDSQGQLIINFGA
ncbi:MAG: NUDIX domain-containing protein [Anaerolineales bacterium]|nr:NUDIX domain-containing protein [Anaerolineales bacterium]